MRLIFITQREAHIAVSHAINLNLATQDSLHQSNLHVAYVDEVLLC